MRQLMRRSSASRRSRRQAQVPRVTIDLHNQSDGFTITGSAFADTITGSSGADTIVGGSGGDTLTGGAGADTFAYTAIADLVAGAGNFDTIRRLHVRDRPARSVGDFWAHNLQDCWTDLRRLTRSRRIPLLGSSTLQTIKPSSTATTPLPP